MGRARTRASVRTYVTGAVCLAVVSCMSRPATKVEPSTKVSLSSNVSMRAIDKVDLVLAIDNSASMGDKQKFLAKAVPALVRRLTSPTCVPRGQGVADDEHVCPNSGDDVEFRPIKDIHVAVITSSLGGFGSSSCADDPNAPAGSRMLNDHALPSARGVDASGTAVEVPMEEGNFLAWLPDVPENATKPKAQNPYTTAEALGTAVANLVRGAGEKGCGLEAQLESVYRFLMQPDPWESVARVGRSAQYVGVDNKLLAARKKFLRPDSLVAVLMLTDEDDSSVDPVSIGGAGFAFMESNFPIDTELIPPEVVNSPGRMRENNAAFGGGTTAPRATSVCESEPLSRMCTSCAFKYACTQNGFDESECTKLKQDLSCNENNGFHTQQTDSLNVRFHRMKARYGLDPQYPIARYIAGFTRAVVPNRLGEHDSSGNYVDDVNGLHGCTNPLFAKTLPDGAVALASDADANAANASGKLDFCRLPRGTRDPGHVFFAIVGGVPNELLRGDSDEAVAEGLSEAMWSRILGKDPLKYDFSGIDPRMFQSIEPRSGRPGPGSKDSEGDDPLNMTHRDWNSGHADLQYACTFPLPPDMQRAGGDCYGNSDAPLCAKDRPVSEVRTQIRAKAYPTIRELALAKAMGNQGVVASLCPQRTAGAEGDPLYGYNPAMLSLVDRLKDAFAQCLPRPLTADPASHEVQCSMIEELPLDEKRPCAAIPGRIELSTDIVVAFREQQRREQGAGAIPPEEDRTKRSLCGLRQLQASPGETCRFGEPGWCYVSRAGGKSPANRCAQAIVFSDAGVRAVAGSTVHLQCIDQTKAE